MKREIRLAYPGKCSRKQLLAAVQPKALRLQEELGQPRPDGWRNRLISGDNLSVLRGLLDDPAVAGKVTLVYIDPPFSTDQEYRVGAERTATVSSSAQDAMAYSDHLMESAYLEFLRRRLLLLAELLSDRGSIYVHIGLKMGHFVKLLLDEILGAENFVNDIARIKCNPKNFSRRAYGNVRDMILFYTKKGLPVWNEARETMTPEEIARLFPKTDAGGRRYTTTPLHAPGETKNGATGEEWKGLWPPRGRHWRYDPAELTRLDEAGLIEWSSTGNPRKRIYAEDVLRSGKKRQDVWSFKDPAYPSYPTEKSLKLLETIVQTSSNPGDLVLDCFAGSGTTLVAAEMHGRRWIGIDNSPAAIHAARRRLLAIEDVRAFSLLQESSRVRALAT